MPSPSRHDPSRPAIAVLGTGRMGAPIARNLLAARLRGVGMEPHPQRGLHPSPPTVPGSRPRPLERPRVPIWS